VHEAELADERWVHNLEHGGVVFLANCPEGCPRAWDRLVAMVEGLGPQVILSPYAAMEWRFAAVAWGWRQEFSCVDEAAMEDFHRQHVDDAPESSTSDPSESCM
jgi:hypothetical protein